MEKQAVVKPGITPDLEPQLEKHADLISLDHVVPLQLLQKEAKRLEEQDPVSRLADGVRK